MCSNLSWVAIFSRLGGTSLGLGTWDLSQKNLLKRLAFSVESSNILPDWSKGGMDAFLDVFDSFCKIPNFFLDEMLGLDQTFFRVEKYLFFSCYQSYFAALWI